MNPFEYVNSINYGKKDIMVDDIAEKAYNGFMVNRSLSYFPDTVLLANEMNQNAHLDKRMQYDFLMKTVRKRKRFSKWGKASTEKEIEAIKIVYGYSNDKARSIRHLFSEKEMASLIEQATIGGKKKSLKS